MSGIVPTVDRKTFLFPPRVMTALRAALPSAAPAQVTTAVNAYLALNPVAASPSVEFVQTVPSATWNITVPAALARRPNVSVYGSDGELIEPDIFATAAQVILTFPSPYSGSAVLN